MPLPGRGPGSPLRFARDDAVGMPLHVAFLRGVGGPKPTPGDELRRAFAAAGYDPVVPVIATGNVVFGLGRKRKVPAPDTLATMLGRHFGYPLPVVLRSGPDILAMIAGDVFRGIDTARQTRFVAMLADGAPDAGAMPDALRRRRLCRHRPAGRESLLHHRHRPHRGVAGHGDPRPDVSEARHDPQFFHHRAGRGGACRRLSGTGAGPVAGMAAGGLTARSRAPSGDACR